MRFPDEDFLNDDYQEPKWFRVFRTIVISMLIVSFILVIVALLFINSVS